MQLKRLVLRDNPPAKTTRMIRREQNQRKHDRETEFGQTVRGITLTLAETLISPRWQGKGLT